MSRTTGAPTWLDLGTNDPDAAEKFYSEVFGWTFADQGEEYGGYRIISQGDAPVGGLMKNVDETGTPLDQPAAWTIYLNVPDIAKAVADIEASGGRIVMPPMEVPASGHMAVALAPSGAGFGLWQATEFEGFEAPLTAGTPVWFEAMSTDFDADLEFYRDALGWDVQWMGPEGGEGGLRYVTHGAGDDAVAGLCDAAGSIGDAPSFWRAYFAVEDVDATIAKVEAAGGKLIDGPEDSPFGRFATIADPEGASFQINQGTN